MEEFSCMTRVISGSDPAAALKPWAGQSVFLVTDLHLRQSGAAKILLPQHIFGASDCWEVSGNASMHQAVEGSRKLKEACPGLVVALGDRHVLDCAKAMVCFSRLSCPLAVVPTLPAGGSEVTDRVSLLHNRQQHLLQSSAMRPSMALLDAGMLEFSTRKQIAESGFLILANALESFTSKAAGVLTSLHAREAFCGCWAALSGAVAGSSTAWARLQIASCLSGMALDHAGLGLCAALTANLGSFCHLTEGTLCAILLPSVISCNVHAAGHKYAGMARAAGMGGSSDAVAVSRLRAGLVRLRRDLGLPATLTQAGVDPRQLRGNLQAIVQAILEHPECPNNPLTVDDYLVRRILEDVIGRI